MSAVAADRDVGPQRLSPRVRTLWHVVGAGVAAVVVLVAAILGAIVAAGGLPGAVAVVAAVVAAGSVVGAAVGPRLAYTRWRWTLTDEGLELSHGVVVRVESAIPTFRVQQIDVRQGPLERAFDLVSLKITTASAFSDGTLPGIDADRAEAVRRELLGRVAADDGV
ncbi:PH domain-containing protein [Iamia majanohamensis]|uniref:PH domain-containing protein n=1 Tax=Iamia majanohamensis TaxID=467976 RepID=A0AAE9Y8B0_9ACTN|nr:PH domain-containing protein [Iamia majanohamensis]WCO68689.1 PH domain-containing protein [Iamia majanohamensis]